MENHRNWNEKSHLVFFLSSSQQRVECLKYQKIVSDWKKKYEELSMAHEQVKMEKVDIQQMLKETEEQLEDERAASYKAAPRSIERKQTVDDDIKQEMVSPFRLAISFSSPHIDNNTRAPDIHCTSPGTIARDMCTF
jgi:hypothetical protein